MQNKKAKLESDIAEQRKIISQAQKKSSSLQDAMSRTKNATIYRSKQKQRQTELDKIAKAQKKIADLEKDLAFVVKSISQKQKQLSDAEKRETQKRQKDDLQHLEDISAEIDYQMQLESTRNTVQAFSNREGGALRLSEEAKAAAEQLLDMLKQGELKKESHLISVLMRPHLLKPDNHLEIFPIPLADIKELAAYSVLSLQETRSKGRLTGWNLLLLPERLKEVATGRTLPDVFRVFYSWQSWTPSNVNRNFVLKAIENAVKEIRDDETIEVEPVVDRDTLGEPGSVDIVATIFRKIENSAIFVCDATIITPPRTEHPSPNPNVMIELGYAAAVLGWERIVCVVNTAYGSVEQLPFDLRSRRMLTYELSPDVEIKTEIRKQLSKSLRDAISAIIEQLSIDDSNL